MPPSLFPTPYPHILLRSLIHSPLGALGAVTPGSNPTSATGSISVSSKLAAASQQRSFSEEACNPSQNMGDSCRHDWARLHNQWCSVPYQCALVCGVVSERHLPQPAPNQHAVHAGLRHTVCAAREYCGDVPPPSPPQLVHAVDGNSEQSVQELPHSPLNCKPQATQPHCRVIACPLTRRTFTAADATFTLRVRVM
jgi:hypothetical protein